MTRLIALDVGEVRIGVAMSDATRFLASPYTTLYVARDEVKTWSAIQQLIDEAEAGALVIGLPVSLDGQIHSQGERVQAFAERLKGHISVPIIFWDERLSTVEAQRLLAERDQHTYRHQGKEQGDRANSRRHSKGIPRGYPAKRRRQKGQEIDALAAAVILQEYLDHLGRYS